VVGTPHIVDTTLVLPLPHPSGASAWANVPANRAKISLALQWLGDWWHRSE
jgi:hypothetical protein